MATGRILIIEAHPEIAQLESVLLRSHDFDVTKADPETAMSTLGNQRYDVLILGSPLLVRDGARQRYLLDVIAETHAEQMRSTIVVTASVNDRDLIDRAMRANVFAIVGKPFDIDVLAATVAACASRREPGSATTLIGLPLACPRERSVEHAV